MSLPGVRNREIGRLERPGRMLGREDSEAYVAELVQSWETFEDCAWVEACRRACMAAVESIVAFGIARAWAGGSIAARTGKGKGYSHLATPDWGIVSDGIHAVALKSAGCAYWAVQVDRTGSEDSWLPKESEAQRLASPGSGRSSFWYVSRISWGEC